MEPREDIKLFSSTSLLTFVSVATPHPTALVRGKVGIREGRLSVVARTAEGSRKSCTSGERQEEREGEPQKQDS